MADLDAIKAGLGKGEFFLEYLPTVALADGRCVGCEALIRWRHGGRIVPPLEFIPAIENTLLSGTVTYWVIDTVGRELGTWLRQHDNVHISVNVPPGIFARGGLVQAIDHSTLADVSDKLVIEVTERSVPDASEMKALHRRNGAGAKLALDDVGFTESNMVILAHTRVDIVKIDKPFIDQIVGADRTSKKMTALAALIGASKHTVVAEGVETAEQVQALKTLGVQLAQGWYFSRPLPAYGFTAYFETHR